MPWELEDNEWVQIHPVTGGVHVQLVRITGALVDARDFLSPLPPAGPSLLSHGLVLDDWAIRHQMGHGNEWHLFDIAIGDLLERMDKFHGKNPDAVAYQELRNNRR